MSDHLGIRRLASISFAFNQHEGKFMSKKKIPTKTETFNKEKAEQTVKAASNVTIEGAVKKITEVNLTIGKTLNDVSQQLTQQVNEFTNISTAVELKKTELEQLHEKELVLQDIEDLKAQKAEEEAAYETRRIELANEHAREKKQWEYDFSIETRNKNDELNEQIRLKKLEERNRQDDLEREWKRRSEELTARETEFMNLKAQVTTFPEKLEAERKEAADAAAGAVRRDYDHKLQLLEKDRATENQINLSRIAQLTDTNNKLAAQLAAAEARIAESEKNVKSIAEKALESSGSQKTLSELQLMQNSPNGSNRKTV